MNILYRRKIKKRKKGIIPLANKSSYFKEYFWRAAYEIIWESRHFLNKNASCSPNTLTGSDSANKIFLKTLQNY